MPEDERPKEQESESEEFVRFKAAMLQIVSVRKEDIIEKLPKMFRERVADARKKRAKKGTGRARP
jgi:hypothetical protein